MDLTKQTKVYYYKEDFPNDRMTPREVIIEFIKKEEKYDEWEFNDAEFKGVCHSHYTLEDWRFLKKVAKKIEELLENLNK